MGVQMEAAGETVKLLLLDGSPTYVATHTASQKIVRGDTVAEQSEALLFFILQFKDVDQQKVVGELTSMKSLDERLARTAQILDGVTPFPADELSSAAASFYYKLDAADKYKPSAKFKGNVTLVRAIDNYVQMGDDSLPTNCRRRQLVSITNWTRPISTSRALNSREM
ncbi:hypothetical protein QE152_g30507 [Popillia japonica]|uniref:Uncharacterized protein n=1 Tax=Popillia japonica TaxID=7064 RepID=A0AAW1JF00_POPJA